MHIFCQVYKGFMKSALRPTCKLVSYKPSNDPNLLGRNYGPLSLSLSMSTISFIHLLYFIQCELLVITVIFTCELCRIHTEFFYNHSLRDWSIECILKYFIFVLRHWKIKGNPEVILFNEKKNDFNI